MDMNLNIRQNLFVIGDVHGMDDELGKLLTNVNPLDTTIVFVGDLIDRGLQSKQVLERVYSIMSDPEYSSVYVRGNHEQLLLDFLDYPAQGYPLFLKNGGDKTLYSLLGEDFIVSNKTNPSLIAEELIKTYTDLVDMVRSSVFYYQRNNVLCVHAGLDPNLKDFKMTSDSDFIWIREEFLNSDRVWVYTDPEDQLVKTLKIIHGHTPINPAPKIYYNRINIDGGCYAGGHLIGVLLDQYGDLQEVYKVKRQYHINKPTF